MTEHFQDNLPLSDTGDAEGLYDPQMSLPIPSVPWARPVTEIIKRDGRRESFRKTKIADAIERAAVTVGEQEEAIAESIAAAVAIYLGKRLSGKPVTADQVSDAVERVLIQMAYAEIALAYARYRDRRSRIRRLRSGDMRALLGELEEARLEREAVMANTVSWPVRTNQDSIEIWDRERIVEALKEETGMESGLASLIALEVEKQIQDAGITALTATLVRELVGAKLIEHGLFEENEQRRRLGVPLYDAARIIRGATPETVGKDPAHTDSALAYAVKKEYALTEIFSQQVAHAHLKGDIHLGKLTHIDRLHSAEHLLSYLAVHGIRLPGGGQFADPPETPETLLAQMVKYSDILDTLFSASTGWFAFNYLAAPFVETMSDKELKRFSEIIIYECAYRHVTLNDDRSPIRLSIYWNVPEELAQHTVVGPGGKEAGKTYKQFELVARRLAWTLVTVFGKGGVNGTNFLAPGLDISIDELVFNTFEGTEYLQHVATTALQRPNIRFLFPRKALEGSPVFWRPRHVIWHRVALNIPRAAITGETVDGFYRELERLCNLAVEAHEQKRDFIESMLDPVGNAPLSALALEHDGKPYIASEEGKFAIDVEGLYECSQILYGAGVSNASSRIEFMKNALIKLEEIVINKNKQTGLHCIVAANTNPSAGKRFTTLDAATCPNIVEKIAKIKPETQEAYYTSGVSLAEDYGTTPFDRARTEGLFHEHLGEQHFSVISLPMKNASENGLCDFLKMVLHQTSCDGIVFTVE